MEDREYIQLLVDIMSKKLRILKDIYSKTVSQSELARADEFDRDAFEDTINCKDLLIEELNQSDAGFESIYEKVRSTLIKDKAKYVKEISNLKSIIKECTDLGVEIETLESRNKDKFALEFSKGHKEIKRMKQSQSVAANYYRSMSGTQIVDSAFLDQKK